MRLGIQITKRGESMKPHVLMLFLVGLLIYQVTVRAEGICPPGMIPYSNTGINSCGPIPSDQQQPSQAPTPSSLRWESRWGAIATDEPHGIWGSVTGLSSRRAAEHAALADCKAKGGQNCKLETWYSNGCAVLVVGDHVYNVTSESTLDKAISLGMKTCSEGGVTGCHVYHSACSPPQLIE